MEVRFYFRFKNFFCDFLQDYTNLGFSDDGKQLETIWKVVSIFAVLSF